MTDDSLCHVPLLPLAAANLGQRKSFSLPSSIQISMSHLKAPVSIPSKKKRRHELFKMHQAFLVL